jgi:NAD(P)-dependent dehydrogenase (short-subunit alcohol dehydrogenase family)
MAARALPGRRIVVLAGTGSLGRSVVERFRSDGASVLVADARRPAGADRQEDVDYVIADALDESSVSAELNTAPPPQAVVNLIGGYAPPQPLPGLDVGVLRQQLELNLVTAAIVTKYAMPLLAAHGGGTIVHVSSRVATQKGENGFAYSVSKLGVVRLTEAAAAEGREQGVRVNCIVPSIIDTPANRAAMPDAKHHRWPKPAQLAAVLAFSRLRRCRPHLRSGHPRLRPGLAPHLCPPPVSLPASGFFARLRFLTSPSVTTIGSRNYPAGTMEHRNRHDTSLEKPQRCDIVAVITASMSHRCGRGLAGDRGSRPAGGQ